MRLLIFYQYFGTPGGSWSTRMYELTRRWAAKGHHITVVTAPYEKSDVKASTFISRRTVERVNLIIINSGDSNRHSFLKRSFNALRFSLTACYMALTEKYDVVLASSGPITVGIPALVGKFLKRKKMVFEIRDLWPQGALELGKIKNRFLKSVALAFEKSCYKNSKLVVGCSQGMTASVNNRYPDVKTLVISNASDIELFARQPDIKSLPDNLKNKKLILYTGSLGLMDNGMQMIDAMHYIHDNNIILVIIGDGAERSVLEKRVEEHKLTNVVFLGLIPKTEVAHWLSHATACLVLFKNYPVLQTSSPNKMFDAFAAGKPVIHNTTGWIKKLFDKENCGISVKPDDAHELAAAIEQMSHNQNLQKAYSANALRLAKEMFNRDSLADTYLSELDKINQ